MFPRELKHLACALECFKRDAFLFLQGMKLDKWKVGRGIVSRNAVVGLRTKVWNYCNLVDCEIGADCVIGSYVEINGAKVGSRCKVEAGAFIPPGVIVEDEVFIGP